MEGSKEAVLGQGQAGRFSGGREKACELTF